MMKELIGKSIQIYINGLGMLKGIVIDDTKDVVLIKDNNEKIFRIFKNQIVCYVPEQESLNYVPFHVLFCRNDSQNCPGVQYIQEGHGFNLSDVEKFVSDCPCRNATCKMGSKGELRNIDGDFLRDMLANTIFGDYPEKKEQKDGKGNTNKKPNGTIKNSKSKG